MRRASVVVAIVGAATAVGAQTPIAPEVRGPALVWAAYPELRVAALQWREVEPGVVTVAIVTPETGDAMVRSRPRAPQLLVRLEVDGEGQIVRWTARGPLTREAERAALLPRRRAGRGAVAAALRDARAQYGPDEVAALEQALPLEALGRVVGAVTLGTTVFDDDAAPLEWRVELRGLSGATYHLTAEPFGGRVTSLVRTGGGGQ
jgi:hypothetical protein